MDGSEYLYSCVEAGVALSGFAALTLAIRSRSGAEYTEYERKLVASLIERGLMAALLALLPLLLRSFSLQEPTVWALSSGTFVVYGLSLVVRAIGGRTNLDALRGERITEASRWEDDQWELFAGAGPDVPQSEIRVIPLATLIAMDPSLDAVTSLKVGESLWRNTSEVRWHHWK